MLKLGHRWWLGSRLPSSFGRLAGLVILAVAFVALPSTARAAQNFTDSVTIEGGNTPLVALDQDNSGGFSPFRWDVAGNEANFFVRNVTDGSILPFRISPDAPRNTVTATSGGAGIGTFNARAALEIADTSSWSPSILLSESGARNWHIRTTDSERLEVRAEPSSGDPVEVLSMAPDGGLVAAGKLSQLVSESTITDAQPVDPDRVLGSLADLSLQDFAFDGGGATRHLGPLAGEVNDAFGVGSASEVAPYDLAGIALASAQALDAEQGRLDAEQGRLDAEQGSLASGLSSLESELEAAAQALSAENQRLQRRTDNLTRAILADRRRIRSLTRTVRQLARG